MILYSMIHKYHLVADYRVAALHNKPAYSVNSMFTDALSHSLQFRLPCLGASAKSKGQGQRIITNAKGGDYISTYDLCAANIFYILKCLIFYILLHILHFEHMLAWRNVYCCVSAFQDTAHVLGPLTVLRTQNLEHKSRQLNIFLMRVKTA